ncbi:putative sulfate exporter family transporter [Vagococcus sp. PNs007]|uniref:Sulfate exporter family transporter n=1 Tax=Vagococcus proximus TaxID=2991417 RepID=A0ABT5WZR9_9ENTE|nr:putative sulfate exporter family transporter [Vagococcus proximus]MDF0479249.1 putative sulfate exporter family transporter [Vagococcus proximus]
MTKLVKENWRGVAVCIGLAIIAQEIGKIFPKIGGALFAIMLGIICGNTIFNQPVLAKGVKFSESKLLEFSICLTGLTLNLTDVMSVGVRGVGFIAIQMIGTIFFTYQLGKILGFNRKFTLLMSAGNAVCGSSAIGTVSPIVGSDEKDKGISITIVNLTGTILMVALPILTSLIYQHDTLQTSAMIGGVLQSIGQVIASGKLVNDSVTEMATIFKIIRIIFLVVIALVFAKMNTQDETAPLFSKTNSKKSASKVGVPWFITAFFIGCILMSLSVVPEGVSFLAKKVSNQFEIIALAGIGMRVKFKDLVKEGPKSMGFGLLVGVSQVVLAYVLIKILL